MDDGAAILTPAQLAFLAAARRAFLATIAPDGHARLVPACFALDEIAGGVPAAPTAWIPLDDKPKSTSDVRSLARVRDLLERPTVTLLVDRWSEDWSELAWLRCVGHATLMEPGDLEPADHARILAALRAKHPQYRGHALEDRPLIRIAVHRASSWGPLESGPPKG